MAQESDPALPTGQHSAPRIVAYYVPAAGARPTDRQLREALATTLPEYMIPSDFVALDALPATPNGKVDRRRLPVPDRQSAAPGHPTSPPDTDLERQLHRIWENFLGRTGIGVTEDFLELGGQSLLAARIAAQASRDCGAAVSAADVLTAGTIRRLAETLAAARSTADVPSVTHEERSGPQPLSVEQRGLWLLNQINGPTSEYNEPVVLRLTGTVDVDHLQHAVEQALRRNPALRTSFGLLDGEPVQYVTEETIAVTRTDLGRCDRAGAEQQALSIVEDTAAQPFDLGTGPLARAHLVSIDPSEHVLVFVTHHIVFDARSAQILLRELAEAYRAAGEPTGRQRPVPAITYADYAVWARQHAQEPDSELIAHWRKTLADLPALDLPYDVAAPTVADTEGDGIEFVIDAELAKLLRGRALDAGVTPFVLFLGAYALTLSRFTGQHDVPVGIPVATRPDRQADDVIGYFVNTLVVRADLSGDPTFGDLLDRLRTVVIGAMAHQNMPFERLVQELADGRDAARGPLIQTMFAWDDELLEDHWSVPGIDVRRMPSPVTGARMELSLAVRRRVDGGLDAVLGYATGRFTEQTGQRVADAYLRVLTALADEPAQRVGSVPLVTGAERTRQLALATGPALAVPPMCVPDLMAEQMRRRPDEVAVDCGATAMTYAELDARATRLARYLVHRGVRAGDLVGICLPRCADLVVALLAVLRTGAAYLPMDPEHPRNRLRDMTSALRPRIVVGTRQSHSRLPESGDRVCLDRDAAEIRSQSEEPLPRTIRPADLAAVIHTSGSTGQPKSVAIPHAAIVAVTDVRSRMYPTPERLLLALSFSFDVFLSFVCWALYTGGRVLIPATNDLDELVGLLESGRPSHIVAPPHYFDAVLRDVPAEALAGLRMAIVGGDVCTSGLVERMRRSAPTAQISNEYGPAEIVWGTRFDATSWHGDEPTVPIGTPVPGQQVHVLDADGNLVPPGVAGELFISGPTMARGYAGDPQATAARFRPDPFASRPGGRMYATGDRARRLSDGTLLFLGRSDRQVKIRGVRVDCHEIDEALLHHPDVVDAATVVTVAGVDRRLVTYAVPRDTARAADDQIREYLAQRLPSVMVPAQIVWLDALPLTTNGKVDRRELAGRARTTTAYAPPRTAAERAVAQIIAELLAVPEVGAHDDFFALGGHSLLATRLVGRLADHFTVPLSVRDVFLAPTVAGLTAHIGALVRRQMEETFGAAALEQPTSPPDQQATVATATVPVTRSGAARPPMSFAQRRLWFLDRLEPGGTAYHTPIGLRMYGHIDESALRDALSRIVTRHEVLRTRYAQVDGRPTQVVDPPGPIDWDSVDLSDRPSEEAEALARELVLRNAHRPFDLVSHAPFRALSVRLPAAGHLLLIMTHHIACDGGSVAVLARELTEAYRVAVSGAPPTLPELAIQYGDFARWQLEHLDEPTVQGLLEHWRDALTGLTELDLPTDFARPAVFDPRGDVVGFEIPAQLGARVARLAERSRATPFMVLLTAFHILLARYSGQPDVAVAVPVSDRTRAGFEDLIGLFVNTVVVRVDVSDDGSVGQLIGAVRDRVLDALAHQDLPFEYLVDALHPARDRSRTPLCQVMFGLHQANATQFRLDGVRVEEWDVPVHAAKFDLSMQIVQQSQDTFTGSVTYPVALFRRGSMETVARHYVRLLEQLTAEPELPVRELRMASEVEAGAEQGALVEPPTQLLHQLVATQAAATPEAIALVAGSTQLTYRELDANADRVAWQLRERGVGVESLVPICLPRSPDLVTAILGVLKAGAAYVPLDPDHPAQRLSGIMSDSAARVVITTAGHRDRLAAPHRSCLTPAELLAGPARTAPPWAATCADNPAYVMHTSGSTGRPKGVVITHGGILNRVLWGVRTLPLTAEDRVLQRTAITFDAAGWEIFGPLLVGGRVVLGPPGAEADPHTIATTIAEHGVTVAQAVPSVLRLLADEPALASCRSLRVLCSAGEALPLSLCARLTADLDLTLFNTYGPTECSIDVCSWQYAAGTAGSIAPIGRAMENVRLLVADEDGNPLPHGIPGELFVGGVNLARGYLGRPEATAEAFVPDPTAVGQRLYRTGDRVRRRWDGQLEFLGRRDHQVKINGIRVEPGELETVLTEHPAVEAAAVVAARTGDDAVQLVAYVRVGAGAPTVEQLRGFVAGRLPRTMVPTHVVFVDRMPYTVSGKIDRAALPAIQPTRPEGTHPYVPPATDTERLVDALWSELLGVERIGVLDNFFDLGGHSLLAVTLVARLRAAFGTGIQLADIMDEPTVRAVSVLVDATRPVAGPERIERADRSSPVPLASAQHTLWLHEQAHPGDVGYQVPVVLRLSGPLDAAALRRAVTDIVTRHEILRTRYTGSGRASQTVDPPGEVAWEALDWATVDAGELADRVGSLVRRPFDLAQEWPLRVHLSTVAAARHILVLVFHHIAFDGWSAGVLAGELQSLYAQHTGGPAALLPLLHIQYADYAVWQQERTDTAEPDRTFWAEVLDGAAPLELPTDRPRRRQRYGDAATHTAVVPAELAHQLLGIGTAHGATSLMTVLAALATVLAQHCRQQDIVVGIPSGDRGDPTLQDLIGNFVIPLPIRVDVSGDPRFTELLGRVRSRSIEAYRHQHTAHTLDGQPDTGRGKPAASMLNVMLDVRDQLPAPFVLSGLNVTPLPIQWRPAKFDLTLVAQRRPDGSFTVEFEYAADRFDRQPIERMAGHLLTLMHSVVADPQARLSALAMLTDTEHHRLAVEWNATGTPYPAERCVPDAFAAQVAQRPDATAVVAGDARVSYLELDRRANRIAHLLHANGCTPGARVGVMLRRGIDAIAAFLAVLKAGAGYVPLDPDYPDDRLGLMCTDSDVRLVITDTATGRPLPIDAVRTILLDQAADALAALPDVAPAGDCRGSDLAYVIYTSGSTGRPKGVMVEHRSILRLVRGSDYVRFGPHERIAQASHTSFDAATFEIWGALLNGGQVCVIDTDTLLDAAALGRQLRREQITSLFITTALFNDVVSTRPDTFACLTTLLFGGEAVDARRVRELLAGTPPRRLLHVYGPTETTTFATWEHVQRVDEDAATVPIGRPLANTTGYVLDENLRLVPVGVTGELYIGGPGVARGYHGRPQLTAERFLPDPYAGPGSRMYRTGDLVVRCEDGRIQFRGRVDEQVKIRGFRVEPGEVETELEQLPEVAEALVLARRPQPGEPAALVAYVVASEGATVSWPELRRALGARLPNYLVPTACVVLDEFPMTPSRKVDRDALPLPEITDLDDDQGWQAPTTPMERAIADIWQRVLGVPRVGLDDNFFDLGGHSLLATRVLLHLDEDHDISLSMRVLFDAPTLRQFAAVVPEYVDDPPGEQ